LDEYILYSTFVKIITRKIDSYVLNYPDIQGVGEVPDMGEE